MHRRKVQSLKKITVGDLYLLPTEKGLRSMEDVLTVYSP